MSQDFFADLERQLVAATAERARRLRRARARRAATLSSILLAVLAAGAGLAAAVTGGSGGGHDGAMPAGTSHTVTVDPDNGAILTTPEAPPRSGTFTVAVLNGTTVPGLARGVANRLTNTGAKIGTVTNAATQDRRRTIVYFARPDCIPAATRVADIIGLRETTLHAAPASLRAIAGDQANVIVVVGSDQNTAPGP